MYGAAARGRHTLLVAPTGSGKTLAGFLPTLAALGAKPKRGLHTLYVSPLKALAADIARNLDTPIRDMGLGIRCDSRTGDTKQAARLRQRRTPPHILITTPESLSLLLSYPDAAENFAPLQRVIVDELHSFAATKRGDLLALALARLNHLAPGNRRVGLSATVHDDTGFRRWLAPGAAVDDVELIRAPAGKQPQISIAEPEARTPWSGHMATYAVPEIYQAIHDHRTTLVFVNTRAQAEIIFRALWYLNTDNLAIALHHGSLERAQRTRVEAAIAAGELRAVVCTSSLDLGIDWGDVDLVVQVGAPKGATRLLQRIGRANHRLGEPSKAILVPGNRFEYLESRAAIDAIRAGELDGDRLRPGGLDVLAQHLLGIACGTPYKPEQMFAEVRTAGPYAGLDRTTFDRVFDFVATGGYALGAYDRYHKLGRAADGTYRIANQRLARQYRMNAGVIIDAPTLAVRIGRGRKLGRVEEYFAMALTPGDTFAFAGQLLEFQQIRDMEIIVKRIKQAHDPKVPAYEGGRLPLTTNLADRVRGLLVADRRWRGFPGEVREWLAEQKGFSVLPGPDGLLVENFPRGTGKAVRHYLVAYCFEGRNAHQTLGMLLTKRMERAGLHPLGFVATDYVIAVWSLSPAEDVDALFDHDMLGDDLEEWMAESSMLRRSFRNVAMIAGLIDRRQAGETKTKKQITISSDLIYKVLRRHEPDHVLLQATRADAATGLTDIRRLNDMLTRIQGKIRHVRLEHVSPLAVPVLLEIGRESIMGEASEELLRREAELIAEAGMARADD